MYQTLKKCMVPLAPSGRENAMAAFIIKEITPYVDEYGINSLGSVIAVKYGTGSIGEKKKLLFSAHMDEVGMMVSYIEDNGFIRMMRLGAVNGHSAAYHEVVFANGTRGVIIPDGGYDIGTNMVCDIGASSRKEAERKVRVGDHCAPVHSLTKLIGNRVVGRPIDNRIGTAIQLLAAKDLAETPSVHDVYFVFSVQEEINAGGAAAAAYSVMPDYGFAIDVCSTGDNIGSPKMAVKLGGGAAVLILLRKKKKPVQAVEGGAQ